MKLKMCSLALASICLMAAGSARAAIIITEVQPSGSGNASYAADWFELTNTGASAVNITGWKMDDNSASFASSVALRGVTSIAPLHSVVFVEGDATGSTDATLQAAFKTAWFGASVPAGFTIGAYGGSGVGLSTAGDAVNIYNSSGSIQAGVSFGAASLASPVPSFDNAAGLSGSISALSAVGVHGAFAPAGTPEIGSPGAVPEPTSLVLGGIGICAFAVGGLRRRK
jgi:hypothetical protein